MQFLIRILVIFFLVMVAVAAIRRLMAPAFERASNPDPRPAGGAGPKSSGSLVADPVCGTYVAAGGSPSLTRGDETFYFCSDDCRSRFEQRA